ncbi:hypothetical protein B0H19DRAFT_152077 [Mycena capillaripes]|nr:hypothetical protein B0H19DRAFT_152077 [Mycena capillaripes]
MATQSHSARGHSSLAQRLIPSNRFTLDGLEKRDQFVGVPMTWYPTDTGPNTCTGKHHLDSDWVTNVNNNLINSDNPRYSTDISIEGQVVNLLFDMGGTDLWRVS